MTGHMTDYSQAADANAAADDAATATDGKAVSGSSSTPPMTRN